MNFKDAETLHKNNQELHRRRDAANERIVHLIRNEASALKNSGDEVGAKDLKEQADLFAESSGWKLCQGCEEYVPNLHPASGRFCEMNFCPGCWDDQNVEADVDIRQLEVDSYNKKGGVL